MNRRWNSRLVCIPGNSAAQNVQLSWPARLETIVRDLAAPNTLVPIAGTSLAKQNSSLLFGKSITLFRNINGHRTAVTVNADAMPPLGAVIDAILHLGPYSHEILPEASVYLDEPQYLAEVRRRIGILTQITGASV